MATRLSISAPLLDTPGATVDAGGVNFAVYSENAEVIEVCLFDERGEKETARLPLERNGNIHGGFIADLAAGTCYGLRADGPYDPARGHWFDPAKLLVDPYAHRIDRPFAYDARLSAPRSAEIDTAALVPKAIVPSRTFASPADRERPTAKPAVLYEIAVKAFTKRHPAVPEPLRGTVAGLAHPATIGHLVGLGVDAVEIMPIAAWIDERHLPPLGLRNAWGYNPVVFMAPDPRLAPGGLAEVKAAFAALRAAGIAVILDVVLNHSGESDVLGPTLSLRGLDNAVYYGHADDDPGRLRNDTGCGNQLAAEREPVARLIVDALRHWAVETGLDGFRLDLATTLGRVSGGFSRDAPVLAGIERDPLLGDLTIIAEPWDVGLGGYQLGRFPSRWREWNDRYRDDVRRFWRGDAGTLGTLATRLAGSADVFEAAARPPSASVNFIAAHDGFTLRDLVSYEGKHNEANGESNRDGVSENFSWDSGGEGGAAPAIEAVRRADLRALLTTLFVSRGTPMLTAGDEFGRTQGGNNNAYAQDNDTTWLDWTNADADLLAFTARLVGIRRDHASLSADRYLTGRAMDDTGIPDVAWLNPHRRTMTVDDWEGGGRSVGVALYVPGKDGGDRTVVWINGARQAETVWLPAPRNGRRWETLVDSAVAGDKAASKTSLSGIDLAPRSVQVFGETAKLDDG